MPKLRREKGSKNSPHPAHAQNVVIGGTPSTNPPSFPRGDRLEFGAWNAASDRAAIISILHITHADASFPFPLLNRISFSFPGPMFLMALKGRFFISPAAATDWILIEICSGRLRRLEAGLGKEQPGQYRQDVAAPLFLLSRTLIPADGAQPTWVWDNDSGRSAQRCGRYGNGFLWFDWKCGFCPTKVVVRSNIPKPEFSLYARMHLLLLSLCPSLSLP